MAGLKTLIKSIFGKKFPEEQLKDILEAAEKIDNLKLVVGKADEETLRKSAVVEIGGYDREDLKVAMESYNDKYGVLPKKIYSMPIEEVEKYLNDLMKEYDCKGICTLAEIEERIKGRTPFIGPHSKGIKVAGDYQIYVFDDLIYDGKKNYFDCQFKRFSMYSEIQHMIANNIYRKDLSLIKKEAKAGNRKRDDKGSQNGRD